MAAWLEGQAIPAANLLLIQRECLSIHAATRISRLNTALHSPHTPKTQILRFWPPLICTGKSSDCHFYGVTRYKYVSVKVVMAARLEGQAAYNGGATFY
jgi:hypothetical protein